VFEDGDQLRGGDADVERPAQMAIQQPRPSRSAEQRARQQAPCAQVEGGVAMGLGTALTEEALWSDDGRLQNPHLLDYRIPTLGEVPAPDVTFIEGFPGAGPFGAKGLGEPPIIPVPATIAAAVREASGAHVTELPLSAERVARALKLL
jgi:CO/xanthine dehydrogenase Mo-binding subunit